MSRSMFDVQLPPTTITIVAPSNASNADPSLQAFPHLKVRIKPLACLPADLAPSNADGKVLEETFKVVVPVGGRVAVSWHVDIRGLPLPEGETASMSQKVQMAVGEWIALNLEQLGLARFDYPESPIENGGELILAPKAAQPTLSPLGQSLIPPGEPVAELRRIDLSMKWAYPTMRRKRPAEEEVEVDPAKAFSFDALFPGAQQLTTAESDPDDAFSFDALFPAFSSQAERLGLPLQTSSSDCPESQLSQPIPEADVQRLEPMDVDPINPEAQVLAQVDLGMQKVMRLQMIGRFPFVFDGDFIKHQGNLKLPHAIVDASNRFITLSARYHTPLVQKCRSTFTSLQELQADALAARVRQMGRLPLRKRRGRKRVKVESQDQETEESLAAQADHEQVEKISACLRRLQLEPEMPLESQLPNVLAEGVAALGVAKWLSVRQGGGKLAARKALLIEPEYFHEFDGEAEQDSNAESPPLEDIAYLDYDNNLCPPFTPDHTIPCAPYESYRELQDADDNSDDLDAEECYEDEHESQHPSYDPLVHMFGSSYSEEAHQSLNHANNALNVNLGINEQQSHYAPPAFPHSFAPRQWVPRSSFGSSSQEEDHDDLDEDEGDDWEGPGDITFNAPSHFLTDQDLVRRQPHLDLGIDHTSGETSRSSFEPPILQECASQASESGSASEHSRNERILYQPHSLVTGTAEDASSVTSLDWKDNIDDSDKLGHMPRSSPPISQRCSGVSRGITPVFHWSDFQENGRREGYDFFHVDQGPQRYDYFDPHTGLDHDDLDDEGSQPLQIDGGNSHHLDDSSEEAEPVSASSQSLMDDFDDPPEYASCHAGELPPPHGSRGHPDVGQQWLDSSPAEPTCVLPSSLAWLDKELPSFPQHSQHQQDLNLDEEARNLDDDTPIHESMPYDYHEYGHYVDDVYDDLDD